MGFRDRSDWLELIEVVVVAFVATDVIGLAGVDGVVVGSAAVGVDCGGVGGAENVGFAVVGAVGGVAEVVVAAGDEVYENGGSNLDR